MNGDLIEFNGKANDTMYYNLSDITKEEMISMLEDFDSKIIIVDSVEQMLSMKDKLEFSGFFVFKKELHLKAKDILKQTEMIDVTSCGTAIYIGSFNKDNKRNYVLPGRTFSLQKVIFKLIESNTDKLDKISICGMFEELKYLYLYLFSNRYSVCFPLKEVSIDINSNTFNEANNSFKEQQTLF